LEAPAERPGRHSHFRAPAKGAPRAPLMRKPRNARRFQKPRISSGVVVTGRMPISRHCMTIIL
jgi:hypothetical protein